MKHNANAQNARELAFLAALNFEREGLFLKESLQIASEKTRAFAWELALGSMRRKKSLDYLAKALVAPRPLRLKRKERLIMQQALHQFFFMQSVPLHALVFESVELAKKYCSKAFANFLNLHLRKLEDKTLELPKALDPQSLCIYHSFPLYFVQSIQKDYPEKSQAIFEALNLPVSLQIRQRSEEKAPGNLLCTKPVVIFEGEQLEKKFYTSSAYYIQNITQALLSANLCEKMQKAPQKILDLCASPGGKSLMAKDFFPQSTLFANDLSEQKLAKLKENFAKYDIQATLLQKRAQEIETKELFDLVIADLPCSNSGVLFRRAEARWRLEKDCIEQLLKEQEEIAQKGLDLLKKGGYLWQMSCSILKIENEELTKKLQRRANLCWQKCQLPEKGIFEGGYAALLQKK